MALSRRGVLLIPRDRLILVIRGTCVSFPRPCTQKVKNALVDQVARQVAWRDEILTIIRSSRFACLLPSRVVFGLERAALYPPATRSGSRRLSGFLNLDLVLVEVVP